MKIHQEGIFSKNPSNSRNFWGCMQLQVQSIKYPRRPKKAKMVKLYVNSYNFMQIHLNVNSYKRNRKDPIGSVFFV